MIVDGHESDDAADDDTMLQYFSDDEGKRTDEDE